MSLEPIRIVLASASPRRADVLRMLHIPFDIAPTDVVEVRGAGEAPMAYVERLAREKATSGSAAHSERWILAGDTVVALDDQILEKPESPDHAVEMLMSMSGRAHTVFSGLAICDPTGGTLSRVDRAEVWFRPIDADTARGYVATGEPSDKAGAYGIQGVGAALVERVEGDFFTVVGMSVSGLVQLLARSGRPYRFPVTPTGS